MGFPKSQVKAWLKQAQITQEKLGEMIGVSGPTISLVFKGERHLSVDAAERLSVITGIPVEKLLTGGEPAELLKVLGKRQTSRGENGRDKSRVA